MIPDFNMNGNLPAGIYLATIDDFKKRFVTNITRRHLFFGLEKLMSDLKYKIKCNTVYIDGSYVTNKDSPNDIDVCWDNTGIDLNMVVVQMPILLKMNHPRYEQQRTYSCDIFPAFISEGLSGKMFLDFFQFDKLTGDPKGIIQINF